METNPSFTSLSSLPELRLLPGRWAVCKLPIHAPVPLWALNGSSPLVSVTRTRNELSFVVSETLAPSPNDSIRENTQVEPGWCAIAVAGPMPFELVGVVANLTAPLARAGVPVFVISTFDTDYLLIKESDLEKGKNALFAAGYRFTGE